MHQKQVLIGFYKSKLFFDCAKQFLRQFCSYTNSSTNIITLHLKHPHHAATHAPTQAQTHARPSLPINPDHNPTP